MGTISDKLTYLQGTKSAIKDAIVAKGVDVPNGTTFREYATKIGNITSGGSGGGSETADIWVRPTEWLPLPDNVDGVQKVSILNAVFDTDSEFVAFMCVGAYTVDWGDGVVENYNAYVQAEHKYDYSNVNLNSDTVSKFGYKQCVITITPQSGQNLTYIFLNKNHSSIGTNSTYDITTGFLDIRINSLSCTAISIGTDYDTLTNYVKHTMLEQCLIGELAVTTFTNLFYECYALQSVSIKDTSNVTSFANMHNSNYALQKMPLYTFRTAGVDVSNMFNNCYSLRETYPLVINSSVSNAIASMFANCRSLRYVDLTVNLNMNSTFSNVFNGCSSLEDIVLTFTGTGKITSLSNTFQYTRIKESPIIDTSLCTGFNGTFQYCDRLTKVQTYDYSKATTLQNMFNSCFSIKEVPNFNTTADLKTLNSIFHSCYSLEVAPTFDYTSNVNDIANLFYNCKSLTTVYPYVFSNAINPTGIFYSCTSLQICPNITTAGVSSTNSNFLFGNYSLKRMLTPLKYTFSVANAKMSASALNEMFSILPTVTKQTVTITGNYGASTCDTTIATAKGWTVTK